jgi:hypothetical protein
MNTSIELPSGKILNITRFIALIPNNNNIDSDYQLILEGYPHPINLESSDAQNLKIILQELNRQSFLQNKLKLALAIYAPTRFHNNHNQ